MPAHVQRVNLLRGLAIALVFSYHALLVIFGLILAGSYLTYRLLELPAIRWGKAFFRRYGHPTPHCLMRGIP